MARIEHAAFLVVDHLAVAPHRLEQHPTIVLGEHVENLLQAVVDQGAHAVVPEDVARQSRRRQRNHVQSVSLETRTPGAMEDVLELGIVDVSLQYRVSPANQFDVLGRPGQPLYTRKGPQGQTSP